VHSARVGLLAALVLWLAIPRSAAGVGREWLSRYRAYRASDPATAAYLEEAYPGPGAHPYPSPAIIPSPRPWYGQALGAPTYNYGYFGAHRHAQAWSHTGYYGDYRDCGHAKGY
jgi:hypothetical protein